MTLIELLVVIAICAVLIGITVPAVQKARSALMRVSCCNQVRQIGIALAGYHDCFMSFPPGCSFQNGLHPQPHMSWLTRLLPFIEQQALLDEAIEAFRRDKFFEAPPHRSILGRPLPMFLCPADGRSQVPFDYRIFKVAFTDYLGVEGTNVWKRDGLLYLDSRTRLGGIIDGSSNTLMVGERPPSADHNFGWWYAGWGQQKTGSCDMVLGVREMRVHPGYRKCPDGPYSFKQGDEKDLCSAFHFWSLHTGGANFLFADGSVRFLSYAADAVLVGLATRAGGEVVSIPD